MREWDVGLLVRFCLCEDHRPRLRGERGPAWGERRLDLESASEQSGPGNRGLPRGQPRQSRAPTHLDRARDGPFHGRCPRRRALRRKWHQWPPDNKGYIEGIGLDGPYDVLAPGLPGEPAQWTTACRTVRTSTRLLLRPMCPTPGSRPSTGTVALRRSCLRATRRSPSERRSRQAASEFGRCAGESSGACQQCRRGGPRSRRHNGCGDQRCPARRRRTRRHRTDRAVRSCRSEFEYAISSSRSP